MATHGSRNSGTHSFTSIGLMIVFSVVILLHAGCAQLRLPAIDPSGNRLFLPQPFSTSIVGTQPTNPLRNQPPSVIPAPSVPSPVVTNPFQGTPSVERSAVPIQPAFRNAPDAPPCDAPLVSQQKHVIPYPKEPTSAAGRGQIITTPHRIVAPVGSEVVVLAGICGGDGHFALNQPLEWMLSNDSVGQLIEVGGANQHRAFNRIVPPTARKVDGQFAHGRTGMKDLMLTRGTPTPADDIQLLKGQTFVSLASASPGTTYLTTVAPKAAGWDKRRSTTLIHWVDGNWAIPVPSLATAGTVHPLTTRVTKASGEGGIPDWKVRYTIVGGAPAEFEPTGSQTADAITDQNGLATVQMRQPQGQFDPGITQVRVDVIRPRQFGQPELVVESGITSVKWSAPALTMRAIGPKAASTERPFNYRLEISNPGDQVARGVKVSTTDLNQDGLKFISSTPKPTEYGNRLEWELGDIQPGTKPQTIDVQVQSDKGGMLELCFDIESETDGLKTQTCAQTEVTAPCIALDVEGPTVAKVGQSVDFNFIIVNQCNESLRNLELLVKYDDGLSAENMGNPIRYKIDSLGFGQREEVPLTFNLLKQGRRCFELSLTEEGGNSAQSRICLDALPADSGGTPGTGPGTTPPEQGGGDSGSTTPPTGGGDASALSIDVIGQRTLEVGGTTLIRASVRNTSSQPLNDVIITNRFSPSLNPIEVTDIYRQGWYGDELAFNLGTLQPGDEAVIEINYEALEVDPNAFTRITASSPSAEAATQNIPISIAPFAGGSVQEPGIGIPGDLENGGQLPEATPPRQDPVAPQNPPAQNPTTPTQPGDNIGIPGDNQTTQGLEIYVRALDRQVSVGDEARIQFTVRNNRTTTDEAVNITMLIPSSLKLVGYDDSQWGLPFGTRNSDYSIISFQERNQMRPGEELTFIAFVKAIQSGTATFSVEATSSRSVGKVYGSDPIFVQ